MVLASTILLAAGGTAAAQEPREASVPVPVNRILDGEPVPACGWPSVVHLKDTDVPPELCTGIYIGGKIIITAAHCMDDEYILSKDDLGRACEGKGMATVQPRMHSAIHCRSRVRAVSVKSTVTRWAFGPTISPRRCLVRSLCRW